LRKDLSQPRNVQGTLVDSENFTRHIFKRDYNNNNKYSQCRTPKQHRMLNDVQMAQGGDATGALKTKS